MQITVTIDAAKLSEALRLAPRYAAEGLTEIVRRAALATAGEMKEVIAERASHLATGQLAGSVQAEVAGFQAFVGPTKSYAKFVDEPTRPHVIRPVRAKVLRFASSGARLGRRKGQAVSVFKFGRKASGLSRITTGPVVYAQIVHHPGTKGLRFVEGTVARLDEPLSRMTSEVIAAKLRAAGLDPTGGT